MEENPTSAQGGAKQRPTFLTVLCILSFIASGIGVIGYVLALLAMSVVTGVAVSADAAAMEEAGVSSSEVTSAMGVAWLWIAVGIAMLVAGLIGVIQMWKLQKKGFYLYSATGVLALVVSFIGGTFSVFGLIITAAFIVMYGMNLKHME
jgi:hypothetical protein